MMTSKRDSQNAAVNSRRAMLKATFVAIPLGLCGKASAQAKIAQNLVQYQDKPKGDAQCSKCLQFQAPDACKVVDGKISPNGWCAAFAPKS